MHFEFYARTGLKYGVLVNVRDFVPRLLAFNSMFDIRPILFQLGNHAKLPVELIEMISEYCFNDLIADQDEKYDAIRHQA
jgi:hypothetical protein